MSTSETDLSAAMTAGLAGDRVAYETALAAIAVVVRRRVDRRMRGSAADREDIVQETLLNIHLKRATWDRSRALLPWVHAVADHKVVDWARRKGRQDRLVAGEIALDDIAEIIPAPAAADPGPDLERYLATLPAREQAVVRGLSVEQRSVRDVARSLGIQDGAVRVALHRGLRRLAAAALKDEGS